MCGVICIHSNNHPGSTFFFDIRQTLCCPVRTAATDSDEHFADMDLSCTGKEVGRVKVMPPSSQSALPICPLCYLPLPWAPGALPLPAGLPIRHQALTVQPHTLGLKALLPLSLQTLLLPSARCWLSLRLVRKLIW